MKKLRIFLIPALCAAAVFLLLRFVFLVGYVPTESMEPTLEKGSYIIGSRIYGELDVGDIVVFRHEGRLLVKRIAAVPGDVIDRNGVEISVPTDGYYMLGDNPSNSYDSRFWTEPFIGKKDIVAKLL